MDPKEASIYDAVLAAAVVIGAILLYLLASILRQQRINTALKKSSIHREITELDKDRQRIAADLHDALAPLITVIKMTINSFELTDPEDKKHLAETNAWIDSALKKLNEISFNLMPHTLKRRGLVKALEEYISFLNSSHSTIFTFSAPEALQLTDDKSVNLYRIVLEMVHNAIRHSGATAVSVEIRKEDNELQLKVSDNGAGFDFERKLAEPHGNGLRNMANRTLLAGGKMFIESGPNKGTSGIFEIPL